MKLPRFGGSRVKETGARVSLSPSEVDMSTRSANSETFCGSAISLRKTLLKSAFMQRKFSVTVELE